MQDSTNTEVALSSLSFESLKKLNKHGVEYWCARDLQPCLGYSQWRYFENSVKKAIESCKQSGYDPNHHFAGARKPIPGGKGSVQMVEDYHLSRFACYLIAQNGDPRKPEIAQAQKYFAIQTRRQELSDAEVADRERLECVSRYLSNSKHCLELHEMQAYRIKCSVCFMMRDTRVFMGDWVSMPLRLEKAFIPKSS